MASASSGSVRALSGARELSAAVDELIGLTTHELRIFDRNLADYGFNEPTRFERLRSLLLRNRGARILIALHDTTYLERQCVRMATLLRQFSHAVSIQRTLEQAKSIQDGFMIADQTAYLHRFHFDQPGGEIGIGGEAKIGLLTRRFQEIWECSEPGPSATVLGLG